MLEPLTTEFKGPPVKSIIFKDWSAYAADKIVPKLPKRIKYTAPKVNEELRKRIIPREGQLNEVDRISLGVCLSYLERGLMEDDFGGDEAKRHEALMNGNVKIGDEEIPLYRLAKIVNKLPKGVITNVIATATFVEDDSVKKQADDLKTAVNDIEKKRGYFVPEDLAPVDDLARSIIEHILR